MRTFLINRPPGTYRFAPSNGNARLLPADTTLARRTDAQRGTLPPIRVRYARAAARPPHEVVEGILRCEGAEPGGPDAPSLPGNCSRDANADLVRFRSREFIQHFDCERCDVLRY